MCRLSKPLTCINTSNSVLHMLNSFVWFCIVLFVSPLMALGCRYPRMSLCWDLRCSSLCDASTCSEPKPYEVEVVRSGGVLALYI